VSHRNAVGVGLVRQRARSDKGPSAVHIGGGVVVPRVHPANSSSVGRSVFAHGARTRRHEIHRHESLGSGRHRSQLHLGANKRHGGETRAGRSLKTLGYLWLLQQPTTAERNKLDSNLIGARASEVEVRPHTRACRRNPANGFERERIVERIHACGAIKNGGFALLPPPPLPPKNALSRNVD